LDAAADRNKDSRSAGLLVGEERGAGINGGGTDESVKDQLGVTLQITVRREGDINNVMRLQGNIRRFAADDTFVIDDGNLRSISLIGPAFASKFSFMGDSTVLFSNVVM